MRRLREQLSKATLPSKPPVAICGVGLILGSTQLGEDTSGERERERDRERGSGEGTSGVSDAEARAGWVLVKSILQGSPAEECCKLQENDRIRKVDGKALDVEYVFKMIRGLQNTDVLLEVSRGTASELVFSASLTRKPHASQPPRA